MSFAEMGMKIRQIYGLIERGAGNRRVIIHEVTLERSVLTAFSIPRHGFILHPMGAVALMRERFVHMRTEGRLIDSVNRLKALGVLIAVLVPILTVPSRHRDYLCRAAIAAAVALSFSISDGGDTTVKLPPSRKSRLVISSSSQRSTTSRSCGLPSAPVSWLGRWLG